MRTAVGIQQAVDAELTRVREVAKVAAVNEFGIANGSNVYGVVEEFPYATAEKAVVAVNGLPIVLQVSGAVAHCVRVLTQEEGLIHRGIVQIILFDIIRMRIHTAVDIDIIYVHGHLLACLFVG